MIKIENIRCNADWEAVIEGMRNAMESWELSDSDVVNGVPLLGPNDLFLMKRLIKAGDDESKFMRAITCSMDITAPLYWWKEFDTYKIGTVSLSTSTMHKIHAHEFVIGDFSHEHLNEHNKNVLLDTIHTLNDSRDVYLNSKNKNDWWQLIQMLPSTYMQKRKIFLNYQVLAHMYRQRKYHKLDEWREFCKAIKDFPYSELFTGEENE